MPDDFAFVFTKQRIYVSESRVANGNTGFLKIFTNQSYEKCIQLYLVNRLNNSALFVLI